MRKGGLQMELKYGKCSVCGQNHTLVPSNNPIVAPICTKCLIEKVNADDLEEVNIFCRTLNIPFDPNLWTKMRKEFKQNVFKEYVSFYFNEETNAYKDPDKNLWGRINKEWKLIRTHEEMIIRIEAVKEGFMLRNQIKWGANYSFSELIALESLFVNTLKTNDISNPMQIDAIKKACKMSVALDRAITGGETKEINDLSKAYQNFIKTAKIDELITASSKDVISNVAQLVQFIEEQGFQFEFYDNVDRDIVDKSLRDMQQFLQRLVMDSTGLETIFETIRAGVRTEDALKEDAESYEKVSLEDLFEAGQSRQNEEFDDELEKEAELFGDEDEEEELKTFYTEEDDEFF